jgi:hypothetical protein
LIVLVHVLLVEVLELTKVLAGIENLLQTGRILATAVPASLHVADTIIFHPFLTLLGFTERGNPSSRMAESLLYRLHSHDIKPGVEADRNRFKEVYTTKYGKVRIYKILSVSKESKEWVENNRICDVEGSWHCRGQYPPGLQKVLNTSQDFGQLEDFNKQNVDEDYQKEYFEAIFHPLPRLTDSFEVFLLIVLVHVLLVEFLCGGIRFIFEFI